MAVRRRGARRRSIGILVSLVALAAPLVPTSVSALSSTSFSIQASPFRVGGSPYAWTFSASRLGGSGRWAFSINARRSGHNGKATQTHSWSFSLRAADITVSPNLGTVKINTFTDLQGTVIDYGSVNLHFIQRSTLHTVGTRCKTTHKVLFSSSSRTGRLGGTFDFKPNGGPGMPTDVEKKPIGITVTKFIDFHRSCPSGGGGGGGGGGCATGKSFSGDIVGPPFFSASAAPIRKTSFLSFSRMESGPTIAPATNISHAIIVRGPASAVVIGVTGRATINGTIGTPFLSATKLSYKGGSKLTFTFGKCKNIIFTDHWRSGSLNVKFDTGAILLDENNPFDQASSTRIVKA